MGTDFISLIEYSHQDIATCGFESIRCVVSGQLFQPRCPDIHHALGLKIFPDHLPEPLIPLRGFPKNLSQQTVETQCIVLSESGIGDVRSRTGHRNLFVMNLKSYQESLPHQGTSELFKLENKDDYFGGLKPDEEVVMGLGTFCPSWMYSSEILAAVAHCGVNISVDDNDDANLAHFGSIVEWMQSLERIYGASGVRLVFWYDQVPSDLIGIEADN